MIFHGVPLNCINQAALEFSVPAIIIVAVINTEKAWNGAAIKNKNGTDDLGLMQVNTSWLPFLNKVGIDKKQLQYDACINVKVGTWILAKNIAKNKGWQGVANYNSATPKYNRLYQAKVKYSFQQLQKALQENP